MSKHLSTQYIPEIIEPKACTHSPSGFQSGEYQLIGNLSNDDGDVNENVKKALNMFRLLKQQLCRCIVTLFCTFRYRNCTTTT